LLFLYTYSARTYMLFISLIQLNSNCALEILTHFTCMGIMKTHATLGISNFAAYYSMFEFACGLSVLVGGVNLVEINNHY